MSVLIKNMTLPATCSECVIEQHDENYYGAESNYRCPFIRYGYTEKVRETDVLFDCPLVGTNGYNTDPSFASDRCRRCKHYVEDKIEKGLSYFYCEEEMDSFYESKEGCWQYEEREDDDEYSD